MKEITQKESNRILEQNLHLNKPCILKVQGRWFDIRNLKRHEIAGAVTKVFGFYIKPDAII
jgi:hypothetical protein